SWRSSPPGPRASPAWRRPRPWCGEGSRDEPRGPPRRTARHPCGGGVGGRGDAAPRHDHVMEGVVFGVGAGAAIVGALGLRGRPNPLHGALFLVANLFCVAVLYLMLRAEFLALAQVIVYAGAIMVLFMFAIMLLIPGRAEEGPDPLARARRLALPLAAVLGIAIVLVAGYTGSTAPGPAPGGVGAIGRLLFTDYLFPFEVTSLLLLAALVGALTLAKRRASA